MLKGICTTVAAPLLSVVTGTVQDASTGEAVIGAAVILQNTTYGAVADADGRFVINNVKPGTYTIEVQMLSYQRVVIEGCQIKPGENTLPLISLQPSAEEIDEVVVTTVRRLSSEAAVMQAVGVERGVSGDGQQLAVIPRVRTHHHFVVEEGEGDVAGIQDIFAWNHYQVRSCYIIR